MAVAAGFEPAVGGYPTNAFEAFTFGRSDTPPPIRIEQTAVCIQIWGGHGRINGESGAVSEPPEAKTGWTAGLAGRICEVQGECAIFTNSRPKQAPNRPLFAKIAPNPGDQRSPAPGGWEPNPGDQRSRRHASTPAHRTPKPAPHPAVAQNHPIPHPAVASGRRQAQKTARRGQYTMHHTRTGGNPAPKTNGA